MNGSKIRTVAICKMCKSKLSARSSVGTGHLIRHQKSCRKKADHAARVQSRLFLILMDLCITRTTILLLLDLSCVG